RIMNDLGLGGASSASPSAGGRSSATPDSRMEESARSHTQEPLGSQSSPLQRLNARRPERKTPAHFPPIDSGFRSVIIYLTICVRQKRRLLANDLAAQLIVAAWQA